MPDACLWLGPSWLNLRLFIALTICESLAIFVVSSKCVNLIRLFLGDDALHSKEASMRFKQFLCFDNNEICGKRLGASTMHLSPPPCNGFGCCLLRRGFVVVDSLFYVPLLIVGVLYLVLFWCALLYVLSSFAIIFTRKREQVALLELSSFL